MYGETGKLEKAMMLIDGIHVPLTAPFYRDGRLYLRKLEHNVRRYSLTPAAGLVAFAPFAEPTSLSDAEVSDSLVAISETAAAEKVLVAGVRRDSVAQALALAQQAADARFDAILLSAPPCWPALQRRSGEVELLSFFRTVADNSPLPVLLWSELETPSYALSVEQVAALAQHPNILGLYDADLSVERLAALREGTAGVSHEAIVTHIFRPVTQRMLQPTQSPVAEGQSTFVAADLLTAGGGTSVALAPAAPALKTRTKKLGFQIMAATPAGQMVSLLANGASGVMPPLAASAPQATHEAYAAFTDGDQKLAALKASRLLQGDDVLRRFGPAATKLGCDLTGYYGGTPRLPLAGLSLEERREVEAAFLELKN